MATILLVDDEVSVREPLAQFFVREGFTVLSAANVKEADALKSQKPDLAIVDWMLGDTSGAELIKKWRHDGFRAPIIFLTARTDLIDKIVGLEIGADDYVTKPFEVRELVARVRAQLRFRSSSPSTDEKHLLIREGEIEIRLHERSVLFAGKPTQLTKTEYDLLLKLVQNPNQVFSREEILQQVWGYDHSPTTRTVDTHILQLRQKLKPELFETVHGIGYRFRTKTDNQLARS